MSQNIRLFLATAISVLVIIIWDMYVVKPMLDYNDALESVAIEKIEEKEKIFEKTDLLSDGFTKKSRVAYQNKKVKGSINLQGARIDDLTLTNYKISLDADSKNIELLSPSKTDLPYFVEAGWVQVAGEKVELPNSNTIWQAEEKDGKKLLSWTNAKGIKFMLEIGLDDNYMFDITQKVSNIPEDVKLSNYALINRVPFVAEDKNVLIHEGAIAVANNNLIETEFEKLNDATNQEVVEPNWLGFSDKYWLTALIPAKGEIKTKGSFKYIKAGSKERYQGSFITEALDNKNGVSEYSFKLFSGAKELELLDAYQNNFDIPLFDRAVDFGYLYFITKPIFILLHWFYTFLGNFGFAILGLTVFIKLLLFPLAQKGYKGMNRLKVLQPKMTALKERYKDDPEGLRKAMIDLYRKEGVNPMGGCLPMLLQIPVFFALYKVLYVSIEMRHAAFFGWIKDLSAPDPTSIFNLFGLLPIDLPSFLTIGVFPILMALTMYIQQRLNPEPTDPIQAKVMRLMPLMFLFMFSSFPSGLVIYWAWSNFLSILQQVLIKRMSGEEVKFYGRKKKA